VLFICSHVDEHIDQQTLFHSSESGFGQEFIVGGNGENIFKL